ncbi:MAG: DUF933 domain-containing protein [Caldilinea sp.]
MNLLTLPGWSRAPVRARGWAISTYIRLGSEAAAKATGEIRVEGREYVVQDGDVIHFRFNV